VQTIQRVAAAVFGLVLAALIPFWAIKGTQPAGDAALVILYGLLGASALVWLVVACLRRPSRRGKDSDAASSVYIRPIISINVTIIHQTRPTDTPSGAPEPPPEETRSSDDV
jgi:hypothetical protein